MSMKSWYNDADRETPQIFGRQICPIATLFITNAEENGLGLNPVFAVNWFVKYNVIYGFLKQTNKQTKIFILKIFKGKQKYT